MTPPPDKMDLELGTVTIHMLGDGTNMGREICEVDEDMYQVCRRRGHEAKYGLAGWSICRWCGVHFKYELVEKHAPKPGGPR